MATATKKKLPQVDSDTRETAPLFELPDFSNAVAQFEMAQEVIANQFDGYLDWWSPEETAPDAVREEAGGFDGKLAPKTSPSAPPDQVSVPGGVVTPNAVVLQAEKEVDEGYRQTKGTKGVKFGAGGPEVFGKRSEKLADGSTRDLGASADKDGFSLSSGRSQSTDAGKQANGFQVGVQDGVFNGGADWSYANKELGIEVTLKGILSSDGRIGFDVGLGPEREGSASADRSPPSPTSTTSSAWMRSRSGARETWARCR